jgi:ubiquinone/menaquinone biosynthesis C-methylase UbiE
VEIPSAGNSGILNLSDLNEHNDMVTDLADSSVRKKFEQLYIALREKERRVYTDEQVAQLPIIESSHIHSAEWAIRNRSAARLLNYLGKKNRNLTILEIGCGNGWFCGRLGDLPGSIITGLDINEFELNQAKRVFENKTNIHFRVGDIINAPPDEKMDIVIFAASIQYFPSFTQTIGKALSILNPEGEIHILDSPFYSNMEIASAQQRSYIYYRSVGYGGMAKFYFHHSIEALENYNYKMLFNPFRTVNKLLRRKDLFPWICIKAS